MKFNMDKCPVMYIGTKILLKYVLIGYEQIETETERDLGVVMENSFKMSTQCAIAVKKGKLHATNY